MKIYDGLIKSPLNGSRMVALLLLTLVNTGAVAARTTVVAAVTAAVAAGRASPPGVEPAGRPAPLQLSARLQDRWMRYSSCPARWMKAWLDLDFWPRIFFFFSLEDLMFSGLCSCKVF